MMVDIMVVQSMTARPKKSSEKKILKKIKKTLDKTEKS